MRRHLIGCEEADSGMSGHVQDEVIYKVPLFLPCLLHSKKLWPIFSEEPLLQEVEPGIQCAAKDQKWQRSEQWDIWGEGQCQEFQCAARRYGSGPAYIALLCYVFVLVLWILCFALLVLCDVTAAFALYDSLKRAPERGLSVCECF